MARGAAGSLLVIWVHRDTTRIARCGGVDTIDLPIELFDTPETAHSDNELLHGVRKRPGYRRAEHSVCSRHLHLLRATRWRVVTSRAGFFRTSAAEDHVPKVGPNRRGWVAENGTVPSVVRRDPSAVLNRHRQYCSHGYLYNHNIERWLRDAGRRFGHLPQQ